MLDFFGNPAPGTLMVDVVAVKQSQQHIDVQECPHRSHGLVVAKPINQCI